MASKVVTQQRVETSTGVLNGHMHYTRLASGKLAERPRSVRSLGASYAVQIAGFFGLMVSVNMSRNI